MGNRGGYQEWDPRSYPSTRLENVVIAPRLEGGVGSFSIDPEVALPLQQYSNYRTGIGGILKGSPQPFNSDDSVDRTCEEM